MDGHRRTWTLPLPLANALASGLYVSYIPTAILKNRKCSGAGLLGTIEALILLPLLPRNPLAYALFLIAFTLFAIWVSSQARFSQGPEHDNPRIVIDEIAGFWWACAFLPRAAAPLAAAFVLFRFLDTVKPFYISRIDRMSGGTGVVLDDVASGILANLLVRMAAQFASLL